MAYERVNWQDYPSKATPLNAENLNKMDEGIANLDAESESLKAFGNEGKLVYVHDGALDTLEPSNLDLHVGSPTVVTEAAQMTDSSKIYVYNGEETGYTAGDWYSYDGEQWVDRGPFNEPEIVTDKELTVSDRPADGKVVGDKLATKAEIDGAYDAMTVGSAEQLISTVFVEDNAPYTFRTAGGYADIGDRMQDSIIGGSVVWNQLVDGDNVQKADTCTFANGTFTYTFTAPNYITREAIRNIQLPAINHKILFIYIPRTIRANPPAFRFYKPSVDAYIDVIFSDSPKAMIKEVNDNKISFYHRDVVSGTEYDIDFVLQVFDLTQMFGTEIADFIYNVEQANPGAGVSIFRKMFPKSYYEYNAGEIKSLTGLAAHETTGFNQWDEEWELGRINTSTGENSSAPGIRSKNFIPVVPSATYYIKTPQYLYVIEYDADKNYLRYDTYYKDSNYTSGADVHYIRFYLVDISTYSHDICINLSWDGERDGEYEPYIKHSYPLDSSITLRGMLHRDVDGNFHYHGDKYESDGTVTRKYGIVDLGTLDWDRTSAGYFYSTSIKTIIKKGSTAGRYDHVRCRLYAAANYPSLNSLPDKSMCVGLSGTLQIHDGGYETGAELKAALDGVMLVYELATPTTEQAAPFAANQVVDDFGTEAYTFTEGAFEMPVGHESKYTNNLRAKLEMAPASPSGDGTYMVKQENGLNSYIPVPVHDPQKADADDVEALENELTAVEIDDTASGAIASFADGSDGVPVRDLKVQMELIQDLHGQTNPYPAGSGKNKLDASFMTATGITVTDNKVVGKGSAFHNAFVTDGIPNLTFAENTRYTLSLVASTDASASQSGNGLLFRFTYTDSTSSVLWLQNASTSPTSYQSTSDAGKTVSKITMSYSGTSGDNTWTLTNIQLEIGSTATTYAPYANICPISGRTAVTVTRTGFNVWDEETERGNFDYNTRRFTPSVSGSRLYSKNFIPVISGQSYYFKNNTNHTDSDLSLTVNAYQDENANGAGIAVVNGVFTVPNNCHFIMVSWLVDVYGTTYNHDISINYPSTDTDYHAYQGQSIEIQLGQTVYGGTLDVTQGVLTVDRAMVTFDGSSDEPWAEHGSGSASAYTMYVSVSNFKFVQATVTAWSNYLPSIDNGKTWNDYDVFLSMSSGGLTTGIRTITSVADWRAYLASNPLEIVYELATHVTVQLTAQQLTTLLGQNNVWSDADSVSVDYVADTKLYIAKVIADALS